MLDMVYDTIPPIRKCLVYSMMSMPLLHQLTRVVRPIIVVAYKVYSYERLLKSFLIVQPLPTLWLLAIKEESATSLPAWWPHVLCPKCMVSSAVRFYSLGLGLTKNKNNHCFVAGRGSDQYLTGQKLKTGLFYKRWLQGEALISI